MIDTKHPRLSIQRQCQLVSISRSAFYYQPRAETPLNLELMKLLDQQFLETPWYGSRQMARCLRRQGYTIGRKRVRRLMAKMGLAAIYQAPRTTIPHPEHRVYKYLLRDMVVDRPNQVWCADITYIPMRRGFLYLVAVMDWATRKVLSWRLSNTMEADFCIEALQEALAQYGAPDIFNTDQGSQFTSPRFVEVVQAAGVRVSMDGRGRWMDNVFIERLCAASSTSASTCMPSKPARSCGLGLSAGSATTTPPGPTRRTAARPLTRPTEGLSRTSDWRRKADLNLP